MSRDGMAGIPRELPPSWLRPEEAELSIISWYLRTLEFIMIQSRTLLASFIYNDNTVWPLLLYRCFIDCWKQSWQGYARFGVSFHRGFEDHLFSWKTTMRGDDNSTFVWEPVFEVVGALVRSFSELKPALTKSIELAGSLVSFPCKQCIKHVVLAWLAFCGGGRGGKIRPKL